MNKSRLRKKRLKSLEREKIKSLGIIEKLVMKYAGRVDSRKGLLRCNTDGVWQSNILKQEIDSYEEFCAQQFGRLKIEEEEEFQKMNILFDKVVLLRKKLYEAEKRLKEAMEEQVNLKERKEGEENLTEIQVVSRRNHERAEQLQPLRSDAATYETQIYITIEDIFTRLSNLKEKFDSTVKITNRVLQHSQRRIDVYWRSAMYQLPELPTFPEIAFNNTAKQSFEEHYNKMFQKAEKFRTELISKEHKEE